MTFDTTSEIGTDASIAQDASVIHLMNTPSADSDDIRVYQADELEVSADNVRTTNTDITELAALILANGLLQNLVGFIPQKKKGKKALKVQIVAGGRRLTAIKLLIVEKKLPADFSVRVKIIPESEARITSIVENSGRKDLSPPEQFRAFKSLIVDGGHSAEEVATLFGIDALVVKRRMKLAGIEPSIFAQYEAGDATLDQLMALTLTDDHAQQLQVWSSLQGHNRNAHSIRRMLTTNEIDVCADKVALFVGIDDYLAAGGAMRNDLFRNAGYMSDVVLLESLAVAKMMAQTDSLTAEGWAWVEYQPRFTYSDIYDFGRLKEIQMPMTDEQIIARSALEELFDAAELAYDDFQSSSDDDDELSDADVEKQSALEKKKNDLSKNLEAFHRSFMVPDPVAKAYAGAVVMIGEDDELNIVRGLIRKEDAKTVAAAHDSQHEGISNVKVKGAHSERLVRQLTAHRTAAIQLQLTNRSDVALVALTHRLAGRVFGDYRSTNIDSAVQISVDQPRLANEGDDVKQCRALADLAIKRQAWEELLPIDQGEDTLFSWLLAQDQKLVMELMAFCVACSVNTVQSSEAKQVQNSELIEALDIDMADYWEPTRETYLAQIKKDKVIELVAHVVTPEAAKSLEAMKKVVLCETAEQALAGSRWLPEILRR